MYIDIRAYAAIRMTGFGVTSSSRSMRRPAAMSHGQSLFPANISMNNGLLSGSGLEPSNGRSEEHTSELQSLMRISYAVFCLKKKTYILTLLLVTSNINH